MKRYFSKAILATLGLVLATMAAASAQQTTVTGTVTNNSTGEPMVGVNILVVGTSTGGITNANGHYSITVPSLQDTLRFSFIGYKTQTIPINGRTTINVSLKSQVIAGQQMVVVGYGKKKKSSLTTAVSSISSEQIDAQTVSGDLRKTLQGLVPGLVVTAQGGQPGNRKLAMRIRGVSSVNGSNHPLVLIDGVVGSLNDINPASIKSITVLKDAASTAIYGSRGSNGIIIVTTKKGKKGPLQVSYSGSYGIQMPTVLPNIVTNTATILRFRNILAHNEKERHPSSDLPFYTEQQIQDYVAKSKKNPYKYPPAYYDLHKVFQPAPQTRHSLSLSGGSEFVQSRLSMSYYYTKGMIWERNYNRINMRLNNHFDFSEQLSGHVNLYYEGGKRNTTNDGYPFYSAMQNMNAQYQKWDLGGWSIF